MLHSTQRVRTKHRARTHLVQNDKIGARLNIPQEQAYAREREEADKTCELCVVEERLLVWQEPHVHDDGDHDDEERSNGLQEWILPEE